MCLRSSLDLLQTVHLLAHQNAVPGDLALLVLPEVKVAWVLADPDKQ